MTMRRIPAMAVFLAVAVGCGGGGGGVAPPDVTNVDINGIVRYEDREYGVSGFTGMKKFKAVRYAKVEVVDGATGKAAGSSFTNASGFYQFSSLAFSGISSAYIRVLSSSDSNPAEKATVTVKNMSNSIYAAASAEDFTPETDGVYRQDLDIPVSNPAAGAFNILDAVTAAGEFAESLEGAPPPALNAFWPASVTHYCPPGYGCPLGEGLYVGSGGGDTDEYDDDVIFHEYGHFLSVNLSADDSPGGDHFITDNDLDLRLAWSEGWGCFSPGAIKNWLKGQGGGLLSTAADTPDSLYVDTNSGGVGLSFDINYPGSYKSYGTTYNSSTMIYASNEVAVAYVLWKGATATATGMAGVWDVFINQVGAASSPINLEAFWDGWVGESYPAGSLAPHIGNRSIYYLADGFEPSDNAPSAGRKIAVNGSGEAHYLYPSAEEDYTAFDAQSGVSYTIQTSNLTNGADTHITLYGTNGSTQLAENDNAGGGSFAGCDTLGNCPANNSTNLSSRLAWSAPVAGTYYVRVRSASGRPPSAGRYGGYTLSVTSP